MSRQVTASAPGKLMLFGEHAVVYGKPCIVVAVDQRMRVTVESSGDGNLKISAPEVNVADYVEKIDNLGDDKAPKGVRFVSVAVKNFFNFYNINIGLRVETRSDFPSKYGFGSSSAVTVATIKALSQFIRSKVNNDQIFNLSYKTVLDVQGVGSGFDVAAAVWGGTIYFVKGGKMTETIEHSVLPLIVGYTGIKADTPTLVRRVAGFYRRDKKLTDKIFDSIGRIVEEGRDALVKGKYKRLGLLMNKNQELLQSLGVSSPELNRLIKASKVAGAYGAKLSGAGGGDCMIAIVAPELRSSVERAIEKEGGVVLDVAIQAEGVRTEKI